MPRLNRTGLIEDGEAEGKHCQDDLSPEQQAFSVITVGESTAE
ncbi:MAG: hypothetical protein WD688_02820 [Candidatus Binatia bacterium]